MYILPIKSDNEYVDRVLASLLDYKQKETIAYIAYGKK